MLFRQPGPPQSSERSPLYSNYVPAGHVEGKAALWMREHGSSGGVVYHNNTDGTCGFCNAQIGTLLPNGVRQWVVPPADAIAKNPQARQGLTYHVGNSEVPKLPPQYNFFWSPP
jgi:SCP1.201-like deaminase